MGLAPPGPARNVFPVISATPPDPGDPQERRRSQPPQGDLRHDQHRDEPDHPRPDVDRDARLPPRLEEGLTRIVERAASGELRYLAERGLIDTEVAKLLRVRYHQS